MEAQEEFLASNDHTRQILKGKRTKRQRSSSPIGLTVVTSSSSSGGGGGGGGVVEDYGSITSPTTTTTSSDIYESTEEEEDMANCLIMLAQGDVHPRQVVKDDQIRKEKFSARKFAEISGVTTTTTDKARLYVYECKTCNRTFPSFQALGGHRASHKKPKPMVMEEKKEESSLIALPPVQEIVEESSQFNKITPAGVLFQTSNKVFHGNKGKIHECSICGSEFTSGQALGGHMRRHRANTSSNNNNQVIFVSVDTSNNSNDDPIDVKPPARNILPLDLNLPAPQDDYDHRTIESKFQFPTSTQPLVFSAPALVDCHY